MSRSTSAILAASAALALACGGGLAPTSTAPPVRSAASEDPRCLGASLLASLGKDHLLVGMSGSDAAAGAAPYDLRYQYISGGVAPGAGPCTSCAASGCGAWWGCWQDTAKSPGEFARDFMAAARAAARGPQLPMFTYYQLLQASGVAEGDAEVAKVADAAFMARYVADYRFLLQQIGDAAALVHVEPDFWGYAERRRVACAEIPAAVASADPTDCGAYPDTLAGLGRCMIAMARRYAPNAKVGLHASSWGGPHDVFMNTDPSLDVAAEARQVGAFLAGCGAGEGDFIAADMSDRDAGTNGRWWDATNASLPDFHQALAWAGAMAEAVGRPVLWWQTPVGNMALAPANRDDRVDYAFAHLDELAASHAVGIAFGAGATGQASPDTDGGHLAALAAASAAQGGAPLCR